LSRSLEHINRQVYAGCGSVHEIMWDMQNRVISYKRYNTFAVQSRIIMKLIEYKGLLGHKCIF